MPNTASLTELDRNRLKDLRRTIWRNAVDATGICACHRCGKHVTQRDWSLEHIVDVADGGDLLDRRNLAISHARCNVKAAKAGRVWFARAEILEGAR